MTDEPLKPPNDDRNRAARRLVSISLVAMLLVGVLLGILIDRFVPGMHGRGRGGFGPRAGMVGQAPWRVSDSLAQHLALTADQRAKMDSISARHIREFEAVRASVGPRMREIMTTMRAETDSVLTQEQRDRLHQWVTKRSPWRPDRGGRGKGFGPPRGPETDPGPGGPR